MLKIDDIQSAMVTFLTWVEINENIPLMSKNVMGAFSTQESQKKVTTLNQQNYRERLVVNNCIGKNTGLSSFYNIWVDFPLDHIKFYGISEFLLAGLDFQYFHSSFFRF